MPMSSNDREDLLKEFGPDENPVYEERQLQVLRYMLESRPHVRQQLVEEGVEQGVEQGRLAAERAAVRRVLTRRGLALGPEDEARIEACEDTATLERWLDQAVTAATVAEALQ